MHENWETECDNTGCMKLGNRMRQRRMHENREPDAITQEKGWVHNNKNRRICKMEELLEILEGIAPGEDFENCTTLIDDHILDSFAILSLVSEIEDTFDVEVSPAELIPANFNSAKSLWEMICRLKEA